MNQSYQRARAHYNQAITQKRLNKKLAAFLVVATAILSAATMNAYDNLRYSNLLSQADSKTTAAQTELGKQQYDIRFLIGNSGNQWNCYVFASNYAKSICKTRTGL